MSNIESSEGGLQASNNAFCLFQIDWAKRFQHSSFDIRHSPKFHKSAASGQKDGQSDSERNFQKQILDFGMRILDL